MVFIHTKELLQLKEFDSKSMQEVIEMCWEEKKLFPVLKHGKFKTFSRSDIHTVKYATISYTVDTKWKTLTDFIFGVNGVQSDYIFFDALCVNQTTNSLDKRKRDLTARSQVFEHSKEHHIVEASCLLNCEVWHDMSFINTSIRPILHNSNSDQEANNILINTLRTRGFECTQVLEPGDESMKNIVRERIVKNQMWKSMEKFNKRVQDTIVKALELSQV